MGIVTRKRAAWAGAVVVATSLGCFAQAQGQLTKQTAVPPVTGLSVSKAYGRLHHAGLRVSIPDGFSLNQLSRPVAVVQHQSPAPADRVAAGSVVTLRVGCNCGLGSPAVPVGILPRYTIPRFVGRKVQTAQNWTAHKVLYLTEWIGPLKAGNAAGLYANYRITRQTPSTGKTLTLGTGTRNPDGTSGSFKPTPLKIWARQVIP